MITYHQVFDIYHTIFRILHILHSKDYAPIEKDRLRIFDFLLLFPHEFKNVKLPVDARKVKGTFKETKYNSLPDRKRIFSQSGKFFESSLQCLLSYGALDVESYKENIIVVVNRNLANKIAGIKHESFDSQIIEILNSIFRTMNLTEFKQRSGLIEYRYDVS